ncbi:hypothetical protein JRQ81_011862 [Phrynocephalus forsythii]|uniref:Uncharacterized protein n=1 Tax=Phrynocephalus forsythii TaxID=171643 RepID=A0A9Q0Y1V4_9SAUR|nr:hypothetical protein JRQ81_011862 [Phrynocephalus forsythii]
MRHQGLSDGVAAGVQLLLPIYDLGDDTSPGISAGTLAGHWGDAGEVNSGSQWRNLAAAQLALPGTSFPAPPYPGTEEGRKTALPRGVGGLPAAKRGLGAEPMQAATGLATSAQRLS